MRDSEPAATHGAPDWFALPWDALVVRFSEIALKGGNRRRFVEMLRRNVKALLCAVEPRISLFHDRLLIHLPPDHLPEACQRIARIAGVAHVAPVRILDADPEVLCRAALETYQALARPGASFGVAIRRAHKQYPLTSYELACRIGAHVRQQTGAPVCLDAPEVPLLFRINQNNAYQEAPPLPGPDGLPVGVSGDVMVLFSGGIDSPVATWMSMLRGCRTHFIHFHTMPPGTATAPAKIAALIKHLAGAQGQPARLLLTPYSTFEAGLLSSRVPTEYELILFRRFMARVACAAARKARCSALVTGDNLGQVASQTMHNLIAFDQAASLPVFRPLIMANKVDIVRAAQRIGTFEASLQNYKDCCSLVSRGPQTHPRLATIERIESTLPLDEMLASALEQTRETSI